MISKRMRKRACYASTLRIFRADPPSNIICDWNKNQDLEFLTSYSSVVTINLCIGFPYRLLKSEPSSYALSKGEQFAEVRTIRKNPKPTVNELVSLLVKA